MKLSTLRAFAGRGRLTAFGALARLSGVFYRLAFLGAAAEHGLVRALAAGPLELDAIARALGVAAGLEDGLEEWLALGVRAGVLRREAGGFGLARGVPRALAEPANDDLLAIGRPPRRGLRQGRDARFARTVRRVLRLRGARLRARTSRRFTSPAGRPRTRRSRPPSRRTPRRGP